MINRTRPHGRRSGRLVLCELVNGPLLDRVDIHVEVPRVEYEKLASDRLGEVSSSIRARVERARSVQRERFGGSKLVCNAEMTPAEVRDFCRTDPAAQGLLKAAMNQLHLSSRFSAVFLSTGNES